MGSGTAFPARFNFARHLMDINRDRPHKDAYLDDAGAVTYGMLDDGVRKVASDDTKADVEANAYTWYDPDSADYVQADRWAPLDPSEDDEAAADDNG